MQEEPFTAETFTEFIRQSFYHYTEEGRESNEKVVIVMDNAAQHWAEHSNFIMESMGLKCLTLPPYSPELNPAEKIICSIKQKIWAKWVYKP